MWLLLGSVGIVLGALLPASGWAQPTPADSLSLAERYRAVRFQALVQQFLEERRGVPVRPPRALRAQGDSIAATRHPDKRAAAPDQRSFPVTDVRRVRDLERTWFRERYADVEWSFLGAGTRVTFFDTTRTRALRAYLEAAFGEPTRTMAELYSNAWRRAPDSTREEPIQFEYWFIVNDSIPVRVSDVNGPAERGVIVSTRRQYRDRLLALRNGLLAPLRGGRPAPYVDYYYEDETRRWYRVGYDGETYFRERISRFDITPGRRPALETSRTGTSSSESSSSASE
ncbi:MAG: hypothetical protein BRD55_04345 [Bacteroidetes bacterium SW_9_63_38]|nr:MAG: hypothetical protein BRD55_04345 [Bacteroidetes bacterium SW_9_63_38]